jgi:MFS family permease
MIGGAMLAGVAGAAYGLVDSLPLLLVLRGLTGAGEAALFVAAMTLVADLSPPDRRAEAASYFSVAVYAGMGIGPILGEAVLHASGFRTAFALGGLLAVTAALVSVTVPRRLAFAPSTEARTKGAGWLYPTAVGPGIVLAVGMAAFAVFTAFLPDHARTLGLSGSGGLFAVYSAVCLVLRVAGARLPERLGPRLAVTTAFTMLGTGLVLLAAIAQPWALWVAVACVGVGMAFMYPSLIAFTINRTPETGRALAIASFTMFFEAGTAVGGLTLGALADSLGKRAGFAGAAALCVVGLWVLRAIVMPASSRGRREPVPAIAPIVAATTDLH